MKKQGRRVAASLLAALLLACCLCLPAKAQSSDASGTQTVRFGVIPYTDYAYQDSSGVWRGIDIEYIEALAQQAGFRAEYVSASSGDEELAMLGDGRIDAAADMVRTDERAAQYLFSDRAIGSTASAVIVRQQDSRWDYGNFGQLASMRLGILRNSTLRQIFIDWCANHGLAAHLVEYANLMELLTAVKNGSLDGAVISAAAASGFRTVLTFSPQSYYLMFRKADVGLKKKIDAAAEQLLSQNPYYLQNLTERYRGAKGSGVMTLSESEKDYIAAHPSVRVAVLANDAPYFSLASDGTPRGVLPDYYDRIGALTGLSFTYQVYPDQTAATAALQSGKADLIGMYSAGLIAAHQEKLIITMAYATVDTVLLTRAGTPRSKISAIAVKQRSAEVVRSSLGSDFAGVRLVERNNAADCFAALRKGSVDAVVCGLPSATWLINQTNASAYSMAPLSAVTLELCGALGENSGTLCGLLNKAIAATRSEFDGLVASNTLQENNLRTTVARIPAVWIVSFSLLMLVLVLGLTAALFSLRRREKERTAVLAAKAETERQRLYIETVEKSTEEKNRFFSNISHDMRTPLNAIIGFAGLAAAKDVSPEVRGDLAKIQSSGQLLLDLINDTLTISKANNGKLKLRPEPVDTAQLFDSLVIPIRAAAAKKQITFMADHTGVPRRVILADRLSLQKILLNLLTNAVKYTPPGGHVRFAVCDEAAADGGEPDTVFTVSDDGIGIGADFLPHIYEPFAQENRAGYENSGTGLGLPIVRQLVEMMGGTIEVASERGQGTTFTVRLHLASAPAGTQAPAAAPDKAGGAQLAGKKVLLCEDNALNREIATALLTERGLGVVSAVDGSRGLELFANSGPGEFAAVLMDLRMPVMDGYAAAAAIRALPRPDAASVPIIAMTADAFEDDVRHCRAVGMDAHIAKPIDPARLFEVLGSLL